MNSCKYGINPGKKKKENVIYSVVQSTSLSPAHPRSQSHPIPIPLPLPLSILFNIDVVEEKNKASNTITSTFDIVRPSFALLKDDTQTLTIGGTSSDW